MNNRRMFQDGDRVRVLSRPWTKYAKIDGRVGSVVHFGGACSARAYTVKLDRVERPGKRAKAAKLVSLYAQEMNRVGRRVVH